MYSLSSIIAKAKVNFYEYCRYVMLSVPNSTTNFDASWLLVLHKQNACLVRANSPSRTVQDKTFP